MSAPPHRPVRGRGALTNPDNRFCAEARAAVDDGWGGLEAPPEPIATTLEPDASRTVISRNDSPDVPFDRSVNPYRGCEHGCVYCYARPTHAWLGYSPGLEFETRLLYKPDAPERLAAELAAPGYRPAPLMLGANTDAYQPVERERRLTRRLLEVLAEARHPLFVVTKSALVERDLDLLAGLAERNLARVAVSLTTLDPELARWLEPRAAAPARRLETIRRVAAAGVPVSVLAAPVIPVLTDPELERLLGAARAAGARHAGYVLLRLPHETRALFEDWLRTHAPLQAEHVLSRIRDCRGGKAYDADFRTRMRGTGPFAGLIRQRFRLAARRLGYTDPEPLACDQFRPPAPGGQLGLF
ncbi:MAG: PA0069 family radical SAM protein [Gammaproteobacteria bacterium]|nr:PA0069 family radical SAM protein [Gammaproteobacteria bacterium]